MIKYLTLIQIELEFGKFGFRGEGKTGVPREKPLYHLKPEEDLKMMYQQGIRKYTNLKNFDGFFERTEVVGFYKICWY